MPVHRIVIQSSGFIGAPGFTGLYFASSSPADHDAAFAAARTFLTGISNCFPNGWQGQIQTAGQLLDEATGALIDFTTCPTASATPQGGTGGSAPYGSGVSGAVLALTTGGVNRGRRVRGRLFMVPMAATAYDGDGTILTAVINSLQAAGGALRDATVGWGVWSRPRAGAGGLLSPVTTVRVNDRAAFLTSRRQ